MVSLKKIIISGHSSIHGHRSNKGVNNSMINLTYYCELSVLSEWNKSLCIRLSVYQEVMFRWIKSVTKLHRNVCEQSLKPKCHLLVHRSTLQNKIYYCVLLTMLHVIGHYWYKNQLHITILQLLYTKQVIDFNQRQAEYFDSYKGSVQSYWTKLK